ncbi:uncharacterized protein MELLADRAFT_71131 [Melampsora larici-populina 98AG31]|uniref:Uncharacterized protein n=1 Tax=Melampsora larici-populina (strain 98AG31 / pathotype 3-4-7) TaxID=747676 RepID=F4RCK1_MELLP|nr:uncharacterized protein MELLADRAFT_71131 [Melampsora larici-populina 98AG31]EGG09952.1 hypothetical protein MELLADRAFT_71131 [Melampsora larici-populina 98AG31]
MNVLTNFKVCLLELRCIGIGLRVLNRVVEFELVRDWKIRIGLVCLVSWIEFKQVYKKKVTEVEIHQIKSVYSLVVKKCLVKEIDDQTDHQKKKPFRLIDEILMIDESLMELFL